MSTHTVTHSKINICEGYIYITIYVYIYIYIYIYIAA